jgi:short-chain fatty acids transporter
VPLLIATEGHFMEDLIGIVPTSETIFSPFNLTLSGTIIIALPIIFWFIHKFTKEESVYIDPALLVDEKQEAATKIENFTPADRIENSKIITILVSLLGGWYVVYKFTQTGFDLNLEIVIIVFLVIGVFLHRTPISFLQSVYRSAKGAGGMIIQFPFYAGIMGMIVSSGLAVEMSSWTLAFATERTFTMISFISAAVLNMFVPSAGGQWAVQAHVLLPAGAELGIEPAKTALSFLWGEVWTNLIQPFWALPALAIAGLKARDIMGFCLIVLIVTGVILTIFMFIL